MTGLLRIVLIVVSTGHLAYLLSRIRRAKMNIEDAVYWILLSLLFVFFALCPAAADLLARMVGIYSTANFLFLLAIFVLLIKQFEQSMKLGKQEEKLRSLVQRLALERQQRLEAERRAAQAQPPKHQLVAVPVAEASAGAAPVNTSSVNFEEGEPGSQPEKETGGTVE